MVQAFIDDSKSERSPPFFVLGGYVATIDTWGAFSTEWQKALDMRPRLQYFKYREAIEGEGEFHHASEALRMERIAIMRGVVELFDLAEFGIAFRVDSYEKAFGKFGRPQLNPYYFATSILAAEIGRSLERLQLPKEPLDLIFDDQAMEKARVLEAWGRGISQSNPIPLTYCPFFATRRSGETTRTFSPCRRLICMPLGYACMARHSAMAASFARCRASNGKSEGWQLILMRPI
jgi:hypothetical protein